MASKPKQNQPETEKIADQDVLKPNSQAQQRERIIEPHRKKFEKEFYDYMENKYVIEPINGIE